MQLLHTAETIVTACITDLRRFLSKALILGEKNMNILLDTSITCPSQNAYQRCPHKNLIISMGCCDVHGGLHPRKRRGGEMSIIGRPAPINYRIGDQV